MLRRSINRPVLFVLLLFLAATTVSAQTGQSFLVDQLTLMSRFSEVQSHSDTDAENPDTAIIKEFIKNIGTENDAEQDDSPLSESLAAFCRHTFADSSNPGLLRTLQVSGRLQYHARGNSQKNVAEKPFTHHVKEAISINKARSEFYAMASNGQTKGLSKLYTSFEYCLLPLAAIFDKWAQRLNKRGVPAMQNDFVSMAGIPARETAPRHTGAFDRQGALAFDNLLHAFQRQVYAAASRKDFLKVQLLAIDALNGLKKLAMQNNCNVSLSIHLVESVGLAARNADLLSRQHQKKADNFYRAFIILQAAGVRMFSKLDIKAQPFHMQGIGIITNDLPAIPFP